MAAAILRADGDTGAYSVTYQDGQWVLSHYDGSRPGVIVVSLREDGGLSRTPSTLSRRLPVVAGAPAETWEKVPQAVNLNTWAATIFIGRNGRVWSIHSGFTSPASGEVHRQLQKEFTKKIEQLLAEPTDTQQARAEFRARKPAAGADMT